jgi:hypothetical protein
MWLVTAANGMCCDRPSKCHDLVKTKVSAHFRGCHTNNGKSFSGTLHLKLLRPRDVAFQRVVCRVFLSCLLPTSGENIMENGMTPMIWPSSRIRSVVTNMCVWSYGKSQPGCGSLIAFPSHGGGAESGNEKAHGGDDPKYKREIRTGDGL